MPIDTHMHLSRLSRITAACLLFHAAFVGLHAADPLSLQPGEPGNRQERLEWFRDLGFGLFIHWSVDSQLGSVISHSMVGADEAYLDRYVHDLPKTFNPRNSSTPQDWAALAKLAGMKYVMFTTKHHSGFCMFDTTTTHVRHQKHPIPARHHAPRFSTPFASKDIAAGVYFSPDDFLVVAKTTSPSSAASLPSIRAINQGLMEHDQAQLRELLAQLWQNRHPFLRRRADGLRDLALAICSRTSWSPAARIHDPGADVPGVPLDARLGILHHHGHAVAIQAHQRRIQIRRGTHPLC